MPLHARDYGFSVKNIRDLREVVRRVAEAMWERTDDLDKLSYEELENKLMHLTFNLKVRTERFDHNQKELHKSWVGTRDRCEQLYQENKALKAQLEEHKAIPYAEQRWTDEEDMSFYQS